MRLDLTPWLIGLASAALSACGASGSAARGTEAGATVEAGLDALPTAVPEAGQFIDVDQADADQAGIDAGHGGPADSAGVDALDDEVLGTSEASAALDGAEPGPAFDAAGEPPLASRSFTESTEDILNPERGFHTNGQTATDATCAFSTDLSQARSQGMTLVRIYVRLDAFQSGPLSAQCLASLGAMFGQVRSAGLKVVLRYTYNFCEGAGCLDAPLSVILNHIAQLTPLWTDNADVIATLQAGFIGAWGEWHDSTNGLTSSNDEMSVLSAELQALPASRMLQIRYPAAKKALYGGPLQSAEAFSGSPAARIGHHNDCFLASDDDEGTYDPAPIQPWKDYIAQEGQFTPVGAETCALDTPRSDCPTALTELAELHMSYVNNDFDTDVLQRWTSQGCMPAIRLALGYRLALKTVAISETVRPGGVLQLAVTLHNSGYASLYNPRPVYVALTGESTRLTAVLSTVDPRQWLSGQDASFKARLRVPASLPAGSYQVSLWLPDAAPSLQSNPEYAVQLANASVWSATQGDNLLGSLPIDAQAPGSVDPAATSFAQLP